MAARRSLYLFLKRFMDLLISAATLLLLLPLLLPLVVVLRLTGEGEVFYLQTRVGYRQRKFRLIKFATMLKDSPNLGTRTITTKNDPRVFPFGHFLRKTKLNELPQLINVLKGDMSIVGPRPLTEECYAYFPEKDRDHIYLTKPGLTGIGSVIFRNEEEMLNRSNLDYARCYREEIMPYKLALEIWYLEKQSLWVDFKIILLTALALLSPKCSLPAVWFVDLPQREALVTQ